MDQFREHEIKKIRDEERLKCQQELQTLRKEVRNNELFFLLYFLNFLFQLETLYKSKHETLNEKETRIGDRFKAELDVCDKLNLLSRIAFVLYLNRTNDENYSVNAKPFSKN
jgi:hypothetical protein